MYINRYWIFLLLLTIPCSSAFAREYRIDTQMQFMDHCTATFQAGDVILFKRGAKFHGMFSPVGRGEKNAPIKIDAYGEGERPQIHADGKHIAGLLLQNPSYWEVNGLEITNTNGSDEDQGDLFGILAVAKGKNKVYKHVYINDCYIHDINGLVAGKGRGGIHVQIINLKSARFHDLRITNNRIVRVGGVGIGNSSSCGRIAFANKHTITYNLWTKVYVGGNYIDNTGRNSIIARVSKNAIYEYNTLANSSRYDTGHSIYCFETDGIKIQHNEAYGNVGDEARDRGGFDADFRCINTLIQYNYSHDNMWFCGIMKKNNRNVTIRYNLSQNEKKGIYFYGFENEELASGIHIYNNTHYIREGLDVEIFPEGRTPINSLFENNLFFFEGKGEWGKNAAGVNTTFRNNLYFNIAPHPSDTKSISGDPLFLSAGNAGTDIDLKTMKALRGYQLKPGSSGLNAGIRIIAHGGKDLLKTRLSSAASAIGAFVPCQSSYLLGMG